MGDGSRGASSFHLTLRGGPLNVRRVDPLLNSQNEVVLKGSPFPLEA